MIDSQILSDNFTFIPVLSVLSGILIVCLGALLIIYRLKLNNLRKTLYGFLDEILTSLTNIQETKKVIDPREVIRARRWGVKDYLDYVGEFASSVSNRVASTLRVLNLILDHIPYGVLIIDRQRRILRINEGLCNLFYLDRERVIGNKTILVFNNKKLENLITRSFKRLVSQRENIVFFEDEDLYLDVQSIILTSDGNIVKREDAQDIRDGKVEINLLLLSRNATQEIEFSKLRSQFVANVSHEMRTPLTSIKGYLETSLETDLKDEKRIRNYLSKSLEEVNRLTVLIEDILNLSKIEHKRNILFEENYNLVDVIKECVSSLEFLAKQNDMEIKFDCDYAHITYKTDEELFRQLVKNILENSIFYAGKGAKIQILLKENKSNVILNFVDNGVGISKKDLPYIFQRFYRGKNPNASKRIGSGLGLSIVKHIVELHGGKISVSSTPNVETKFSIILPK